MNQNLNPRLLLPKPQWADAYPTSDRLRQYEAFERVRRSLQLQFNDVPEQRLGTITIVNESGEMKVINVNDAKPVEFWVEDANQPPEP